MIDQQTKNSDLSTSSDLSKDADMNAHRDHQGQTTDHHREGGEGRPTRFRRALLTQATPLVFTIFAMFATMFVTTANAMDLPGAAQTSYGVSQNGAFQYQVPIVIPAGTNGVQPSLSLSYSSDRSNGPMGVGWGLAGLSSINRCSRSFAAHGIRKGANHKDDDQLCLNGKLLILVGGGYGNGGSEYRTEIDEFSRIKAIDNGSTNINGGTAASSFTVEKKNGMIYHYGSNPSSQFKLPSSSSIHQWKLSKVEDRNGNYYEVTYDTSDGLPEKIDYTANSALTADKQVDFIYASRDDERSRFVVGKKITQDRRLASIKVTKSGTLIRQYQIAYEAQTNALVPKRSRVTSITECGLNGQCMPPIQIEWRGETGGFNSDSSSANTAKEPMFKYDAYDQWVRVDDPNGGTTSSEIDGMREIQHGEWVDVNGDGELDQVIAYTNTAGTEILKTFIKTGNDFIERPEWDLPKALRDYTNSHTNSFKGRFTGEVINQGQLVDVNGDGLVDVVYSYRFNKNYLQGSGGTPDIEELQETHINTGSGFVNQGTYVPKDYIFEYTGGVFGGNAVETLRGRFADINGDGLVDWITSYNYRQSSGVRKSYINNGAGAWIEDSSYAPPGYFREYYGAHTLQLAELVDADGDGLLDWLESYKTYLDNGVLVSNTYLNNGNGFDSNNSQYALGEAIFDHTGYIKYSVRRGSFIDINGDGLRDWVRSYAYNSVNYRDTKLNTGKGWDSNNNYTPPYTHIDYSHYSDAVETTGFYVDVNRDGLVDFTQSYKNHFGAETSNTWLNTGTGWISNTSYNAGERFFDYSDDELSKTRYGHFIDINSDGSRDWVKSRDGLPLTSKVNRLDKIDLVSKVTTTLRAEIKPNYLPLTAGDEIYTKIPVDENDNVIPGVEADDAYFLEAPICVVSELQVSNADGSGTGFNTTEYSYEGAQVHRLGRGYLGFHSMTVLHERKDLGVDTQLSEHRQYMQGFPFTGMMEKVAIMKIDNVNGANPIYSPISMTTSGHDSQSVSSVHGVNIYFPYTTSTYSTNHELDGQHYKSTYVSLNYDSYGNITASNTKVGTFTVNTNNQIQGAVLRETGVASTYKPADLTNWFVGQLENTVTTLSSPDDPSDPNIVRTNSFTYHSGSGLLHTSTREPNASAYLKLVTTYVYDGYGKVLSETLNDGTESRTSHIAYDTQHRLPITLTNAEDHVSNIVYDVNCDAPQAVTDANSLSTNYEYDNFCRQRRVTNPAGNVSTTDYTITGVSCPANLCTDAVFSMRTKRDGAASVTTYYNQLSLLRVSETTGMMGKKIYQETEYDHLGRTKRTSLPYFDIDIISGKYWTTAHYDELDRPTQTDLPYNASTYQSYSVDATSGLPKTISTDAEGFATTSYSNALGQVVEIVDAKGRSLTYDYDVQGNLTRTTDALNNSIVVGYDNIGRRDSLDDPDMGLSSFVHNAFGEMISQTDAKNQVMTMAYDKLGRMVSRTAVGSASESGGTSTFLFDNPNNEPDKLIGAPNSMTGPNGFAKDFTYDSYGRPLDTTTTIKSDTFTQGVTYDADGRLASRRYPESGTNNPFVIEYHYLNGYLYRITGEEDSSGFCLEHWRADEYDALGRMKQDTLGKIVQTTRTYDQTQGTLENIKSDLLVAGGANVQNLAYQYDNVGNVDQRERGLVGDSNYKLESFDYDELHRLEEHKIDGNIVTTVSYDAIGNITSKSDVGSYEYNGSGPHAVSKVNSPLGQYNAIARFQTAWEWNGETVTQDQADIVDTLNNYSYDANGNITEQGNRALTWTAFDKPASMTLEDQSGNYRGSQVEYGAQFQRIWKREGVFNSTGTLQSTKQTTIYIGKEYERISEYGNGTTAGPVKHRYTINTGSNIVQIERADGTSTDEVKYMLTDNLGSTNIILNASAVVVQELEFDPWGMRTTETGQTGGNVNGITNRGYTGHETDDEVGLVNMNARIYDPYLGRFLSADSVLPDAYDMQQYNRYSYVTNNPLKFTDPTGHIGRCLGCEGAPKGGIPIGNSGISEGRGSSSNSSSGPGAPLEPLDGEDGAPPPVNAAGTRLAHGDSVITDVHVDENGNTTVSITTYFDPNIGAADVAFSAGDFADSGFSQVNVSSRGGGFSSRTSAIFNENHLGGTGGGGRSTRFTVKDANDILTSLSNINKINKILDNGPITISVQEDEDGSSNVGRHINIDPRDIGSLYQTLLPENTEHMTDEEFNNFPSTYPFSPERIIVHEMVHIGQPTPNIRDSILSSVNSNYEEEVIIITNEIMGNHFGEPPRNPKDHRGN